MPDGRSLSSRILDATEVVLQQHGAEKTNVVDVARVLGMSHANIYKHFPSKRALLDAVAARWLDAVEQRLRGIAEERASSPSQRLAAWFHALRKLKRQKLCKEPALFRIHFDLVASSTGLATKHVEAMLSQLARIIADGVESGELRVDDPRAAARAVLHATSPFHHPAMLMHGPPPKEADAAAVLALVLAGLRR